MREVPTDDTINPVAKRISHPAGQYFPRPTVTPQEQTSSPPSTRLIVVNLQAYTEYEFQVLSENALGKAASEWTRARTLEAGNIPSFTGSFYWLRSLGVKYCVYKV